MRRLELEVNQLLPTYMTPFTAAKKSHMVIKSSSGQSLQMAVQAHTGICGGSFFHLPQPVCPSRPRGHQQGVLTGAGHYGHKLGDGVQGSNMYTGHRPGMHEARQLLWEDSRLQVPTQRASTRTPSHANSSQRGKQGAAEVVLDLHIQVQYVQYVPAPAPAYDARPTYRAVRAEGCAPAAHIRVYKPATFPVHWEVNVTADLNRDMALGVLEGDHENTPVTWWLD